VQRFFVDCVLITENKKKILKYKDMKTLTKTLFAAALTAVLLSSSVLKSVAAEPIITESASSSQNFNMIWVSGNVKIVLTQGDKQGVVGSFNYDSKNTSVLSKGQTLYINSTESSQVTLNITVKDLRRVEAYGQSVVVTSNSFNVENLQLFLNQSSIAKINTKATSLYTIVKDDAKLKLNGSAGESTMVASNMKNIRMNDFASLKSSSYATEAIMTAEQNAIAFAK